MATPGNDRHLRKLRARLVEGAKRRVFEWPDRETAFRSLRSNSQTVKWDERVLKAFVVRVHANVPPVMGIMIALDRNMPFGKHRQALFAWLAPLNRSRCGCFHIFPRCYH
jgi:hypothetical protein